jgi:DNA-binding PadR family transcriptional regulator
MNIITRLEEALLIAIIKLEDNAYGVTINKEVSRTSQKKYTMGALYFALDQLLKKGFVTKRLDNPTPQRGGRSKTYYLVTRTGRQALQKVREYQQRLWQDFSALNHEKGKLK